MSDRNKMDCTSISFEPTTNDTLQRDQEKIRQFFNLSIDELAVLLGTPSESLSIDNLKKLSGTARASIDMQTALLNAVACSPDERVQAILSGLKADLCLTNCTCAKICRIETEVLENFLTTGSASDSDKYKICIGCFILRSLWDLRVKEDPENL